MSAILDALNKKGPDDPKKKGPKASFSYQSEPESVRSGRGKRLWLFLLLPIPLVLICLVAGVLLTGHFRADENTTVSIIKGSADQRAAASPESTLPDESNDRVNRLVTEMEFMKQTIDRLASENNRLSRQPVARPAASNGGTDPAQPPAPSPETVLETAPATGANETVAQPAPVEQTPPVRTETPATRPPRPPAGDKPDIKVEGTMVTPKGPAAMVSGQLLYVGDTAGAWEITEVGDGWIKVQGWPKRIYIE